MLHHLQAIKMIFLQLFLIHTFKDPNWAKNLINLAENLFFKFNSAEFMEFVFSKSDIKVQYLSKLIMLFWDRCLQN